jgi:hypothetical protein
VADIESELELIVEHCHLLEHALDGRFDTEWEARAFKHPLGNVLERVTAIHKSLEALRAVEGQVA